MLEIFVLIAMTTIRHSLTAARSRLTSDSASLDVQMLLAEVLAVERAYLLAHPEQELTPEQERQFNLLVDRLAIGEPLPYILGRRAFYDRDFAVSPAVLIPRPETELLLEQALAFLKQHPELVVVDVGTGSGALAVTLASHYPQTQVYATDISLDALAVARRNAQTHGATVTFFAGNLLEPLIERGIKADLIMANLPYIPTGDLADFAVSRYEPRLALDGGNDGLDSIRELLRQAPPVCNDDALILLEIGAEQSSAVLDLVQQMLKPGRVAVLKDYAGHDRIVQVEL
jgi:release factor glutamine methyltransferase